MTFKVKDILKIVSKYSTTNEIKKLNEVVIPKGKTIGKYKGILDMYEQIGLPVNPKALPRSITPFLREIGPAFDPKKINLTDFKTLCEGLNKIINGTMKLENLLKAKGIIKKHLTTHNGTDRNNKYHDVWYDSGLSMKDNFVAKKEKTALAVNKKNTNVLTVNVEQAQEFYRSIFFKNNKDIIDLIISAQSALGSRLIEILSSKVSKFSESPDNKIKQEGTAKEREGKFDIDKKNIIVKPVIPLTDNADVIKWIEKVRDTTDKLKDISNVDLSKKYNQRVNERIVKYLRASKIEEHNELKSSHGLRRLYVNYMYSFRTNHNQTLHNFIKVNLGHTKDGSTTSYNSINVSSDRILDKDQAKVIHSNIDTVREHTIELKKIEKKIEDISAGIYNAEPIVKQVPINKTEKKFEEIDKAVADGATSYKALQDLGYTTYMIAKYKRARGIKRFQPYIKKKNDK